MLCKAKNCRFSDTHIVKAHQCGTCHQLGHGLMECGRPDLIAELAKDDTKIPFDMCCCATECKNINTHTTDGHRCTHCGQYSHDAVDCPERLWQIKMERNNIFDQSESGYKQKKNLKIKAHNQMKWEEHKIYTKLYGGMGCIWYARRTNNFDKIELFFMHSDNWGQYGPETDDRPKLEKFLEGYRCIDKE